MRQCRDRFFHLIRDRIVDNADDRNQLPWEEGMHQEFGQTPAAAIIVFDRVPDAGQRIDIDSVPTGLRRCPGALLFHARSSSTLRVVLLRRCPV
jgi:hypothetical protein